MSDIKFVNTLVNNVWQVAVILDGEVYTGTTATDARDNTQYGKKLVCVSCTTEPKRAWARTVWDRSSLQHTEDLFNEARPALIKSANDYDLLIKSVSSIKLNADSRLFDITLDGKSYLVGINNDRNTLEVALTEEVVAYQDVFIDSDIKVVVSIISRATKTIIDDVSPGTFNCCALSFNY